MKTLNVFVCLLVSLTMIVLPLTSCNLPVSVETPAVAASSVAPSIPTNTVTSEPNNTATTMPSDIPAATASHTPSYTPTFELPPTSVPTPTDTVNAPCLLEFTHVPEYGNFNDMLEGRLSCPASVVTDYQIVVFIKVEQNWWPKPTFDNRMTAIDADGTWRATIVSGGQDELATEIFAAALPITYSPPELNEGVTAISRDICEHAVAYGIAVRSQNNITIATPGSPVTSACVAVSS